jgi:hypothetical protein
VFGGSGISFGSAVFGAVALLFLLLVPFGLATNVSVRLATPDGHLQCLSLQCPG